MNGAESPSAPSARNRSTHLATVLVVVLNCRTAASFLKPPSVTLRHRLLDLLASEAHSELRNLSFLGSDQMDNLLKAQIKAR